MMNSIKTKRAIQRNILWGSDIPFTKVLIIRGIGYKSFYMLNNVNKVEDKSELLFNKYLVVRAGHTLDLIQPVPLGISIKIKKKERKLIISGANKKVVSDLFLKLYSYRKPSAYTGRGLRKKHAKLTQKVGKKDKQKGKSF